MTYVTDKRLCLNADKSVIVDCDSPAAAYQLAAAGQEVSAEDVKKYGLGKEAEAPVEEEKAKAPAQNKAKQAAQDK